MKGKRGREKAARNGRWYQEREGGGGEIVRKESDHGGVDGREGGVGEGRRGRV